MNNQIAILKSVELNQAIVENKNFNLISVYKDYYSKTDVPFFKRIFQKTFMVNNEFLANLLKQNLEIKNMPRSDVLNLSYTFEDPKVAQITLMALVEQYQESAVDTKVRVTSYANTKITERLEDISAEMKKAEKKLNDYKVENKLVDVGDVKDLKIKEIQFLSDEITKLGDQVTNIENDLLATKSSGATTENLVAIKGLVDSEEVKNKRALLLSEQNLLSSMRLIYTDTHPKIIKSKETIDALTQELTGILKKNN